MHLKRKQSEARRSGMSLLEVLAALAIFIFTSYSLTQMVDGASRAATRARRLAKAQLLAETKMDEIVAGALPLTSGGGVITEELEGWNYNVQVSPESWSAVQDSTTGSSITGLNSVVVTVNFNLTGAEPVEYSLSRIILDPQLRQPAQQQQPSTGTTPTGGGP
jgi:type II secretory pathway pseudopilin PulG